MNKELIFLALPNKAVEPAGFRYVVITSQGSLQNYNGSSVFSSIHELISFFGHQVDNWARVENELESRRFQE